MAYRILVVDDEKEILDSLMGRLKREGYDVSMASDGQEALVKIKDDNPDIVILDLMLPKLDGFEVLERIRKDFTDRWRPVIIMSAKGEMDSWNKCHNLEAELYLTKPCTIFDILRAVKTMIALIPAHKDKSE